MAASGKFGTFGGVFTPSILTILGVIMYLRLPWIVGQAGLYTTLAIIIIAHVISVTTGLSVASIATDKKVKAGGNYYIISRSLGLSIGGTLGIALFVGLSFSVSLYIIGFSESFLGFWDIPVTKDTIRIAGTIALIAVTTITFISTSLAIKTQYFIMAAIGLSLLSIFFGEHNLAPSAPLLEPLADAAPFMLLFGIFFPAVTGFEAGVSMSGDLQDPKKSIPGGTIAAVVVGLFVYLGLATYFAYTVNADALVNDTNVLLNISLFSPLVLAGIWGATLSSALGSILGAPRILQATSADRITPRIFARGYGKTNEPRNALLLTFVLAEAGILVGELNLIARVVSMFFITAYGFLNLSSAIESWASTDFQPSFRTPRWVSILGAAASFFVMIELDAAALVGATVILGAIFVYLKKRELTLETGDTWTSVWSSLVREGISRLHASSTHIRNWRPNMLLFTGSGREHLAELGSWLTGKRGLLSRFELIENKKAGVLFPKDSAGDTQHGTEEFSGIFNRRMECRDIYEGIETIARVYGFSGLAPNTAMLGWARQSSNGEKFTELLDNLVRLDYNILLLDYDKERGFGAKKQIDVWWRGGNNSVSLMTKLIKFLQANEDWRSARTRFLVVSDDSSQNNKIYKNMNLMLQEQRLDAEIKIINNGIEKRPVEDIIRAESLTADLTLLGLPPLSRKNVQAFIERTNRMLDLVGTVLLIRAASVFETPVIGIERVEAPKSAALPTLELQAVNWPDHEQLRDLFSAYLGNAEQQIAVFLRDSFARPLQAQQQLIAALRPLYQRAFEQIAAQLQAGDPPRLRKLIVRQQSELLFHSRRLLSELQQHSVPEAAAALNQGLEILSEQLQSTAPLERREILIRFDGSYLQPQPGDGSFTRLRKRWHRITGNRAVTVSFDGNRVTEWLRRVIVTGGLTEQTGRLAHQSYRVLSDTHKSVTATREAIDRLLHELDLHRLDAGQVQSAADETDQRLSALDAELTSFGQQAASYIINHFRAGTGRLAGDISQPGINRILRRRFRPAAKPSADEELLASAADSWRDSYALLANFVRMDTHVMHFYQRLATITGKLSLAVRLDIENGVLAACENLRDDIDRFTEKPNAPFQASFELPEIPDFTPLLSEFSADIATAIHEVPEKFEIIETESFRNLEQAPFEEPVTVTLALQRLAEYLVETELTNPLRDRIAMLPEQLTEAVETVREIDRLLGFDAGEGNGGERRDTIARARQRLEEEYAKFSNLPAGLGAETQKRLDRLREVLNPFLLVQQADRVGQFERSRQSKVVLSRFGKFRQHGRQLFNDALVSFFHRRSEGILLARRLGKQGDEPLSITDRLLNLREQVSPAPAVLNRLPEYYRRMFLGKQPVGSDFWIKQPDEMHAAEKYFDRLKQGFRGALLVTGPPESGKSALCHTIARRFGESAKIHTVSAPAGGSCDVEVFRRQLAQALRSDGSIEQMLETIPAHSTIIIDNLELWWERSRDGFAVIRLLRDLLARHGSSHCAFIVNSSNAAFKTIDHIESVAPVFLSVVECGPFDTRELQQAILLRHRSSGLDFELDGQQEDALSTIKLARMFSRYFDYSSGFIGVALQAWVAHIRSVSSERHFIQSLPQLPDGDILAELDSISRLWLGELLLHRESDSGKLQRIFMTNAVTVQQRTAQLVRAGLIREKETAVFEVAPFLRPFIYKYLNRVV
jgi:amino acid transporter